MLYLKEKTNIISSNVITLTDSTRFRSLNKKDEFQKTSLEICDKVLEEAFLARFLKKDTSLVLDFFSNSNNLLLFEEIIHSNLSLSSKMYILNNLEKYNDFYYFVFNILDILSIEKVNEYDLDKLNELKRLSDEVGVYSDAAKILNMEEVANNNSKILTLSNNIKNMK